MTAEASLTQKSSTARFSLRAPRRSRPCPGVSVKAMFGDFRNVRNSVVPDRVVKATFQTKEDCDGLELTVYTVRISTSYRRGSALSDPYAGVNLCLVAKDGRAVLKTVPPIADLDDAEAELRHICSIVDQSAGANCELATGPDAPWHKADTAKKTKARFQEGHVDEFTFLAPDLGALAGLYIAPESGSWVLDEVDVSSSRTSHIDRFVCGRCVGDDASDSAVCLTPVPPGAVVYGTGNSAVILTKEQADAVRAAGNNEYAMMKGRLLSTTGALAMGGSAFMACVGGLDLAVPFAFGGAAAVLYQWLLQQTTDSLAADLNMQMPSRLGGGLLTSNSSRLAFVCALGLVGVCALQEPQQHVEALAAGSGALDARQLLAGISGFMMYKLAVVGVSIAPTPTLAMPATQEAKQL